jgi:hypothetical protein
MENPDLRRTVMGRWTPFVRSCAKTLVVAVLPSASITIGAAPAAAEPTASQQARGDQEEKGLPTVEEKTADMLELDGFLPLFWDEATGKLWLEIARFDEEILHYGSLAAGIGSNDIGLDRGQLGASHVVVFRRVGPRVLMVEPNYRYRALSDNEAERIAVEDAFAVSILWGFEVAAETDGRVLVDATDFLIHDHHGVVRRLGQNKQGKYSLDRSRSTIYLPRTKGFPKNSEAEVILTFTADSAGRWVGSVAPSPRAVSVRQHHSFVELPNGGYEPRRADPRAGYGGIDYVDYAVPLGEPLVTRLIARHRLQKRDPSAEISEPVEPIVYYLDPGTPEPVRSALLDGARWWNDAFDDAGYRDAFQVEVLPEGADPMDLRYNVIQWVHRSTRGWSNGRSVVDPRTGEILKGQVTLGSLRVRQDYLIAEALLSPYETGEEVPGDVPELAEMALARIRQLSAHEVGHTLGLAHNYIASAQGRASVMDYPHPFVRLGEDGRPELDDAYDVGLGEWDRVAIAYGYSDFPEGTDEAAALEGVLTDARDRGITYLSDQDARPRGSSHPQAHLWDNGADAADELDRVMGVRSAALQRFGERAIRSGMPLATLEEALVPLYLFHRYQVEAAVKMIGGVDYAYSLRGDGTSPPSFLSGSDQRRALDAVLGTLAPTALAIPESLLQTIPPRPFRYWPHRELFARYTGLVFDAVAPAAAAADLAVSLILNDERAARLVQQGARDPSLPDLVEVIGSLRSSTFGARASGGYEAELGRAVERVVADRLIELAARADMPQVRAVAEYELGDLADWLRASASEAERVGDTNSAAHSLALANDIQRFFDRHIQARPSPEVVEPPPGSPIGAGR